MKDRKVAYRQATKIKVIYDLYIITLYISLFWPGLLPFSACWRFTWHWPLTFTFLFLSKDGCGALLVVIFYYFGRPIGNEMGVIRGEYIRAAEV